MRLDVERRCNTVVQGFACVAGSHKANVELPRDWKTPGKTQADAPECVHRVAVEAGDAIICACP